MLKNYKYFSLIHETKFSVYTFCDDDTGSVGIILEDREVRRFTGKSVFELEIENHSKNAFSW